MDGEGFGSEVVDSSTTAQQDEKSLVRMYKSDAIAGRRDRAHKTLGD